MCIKSAFSCIACKNKKLKRCAIEFLQITIVMSLFLNTIIQISVKHKVRLYVHRTIKRICICIVYTNIII